MKYQFKEFMATFQEFIIRTLNLENESNNDRCRNGNVVIFVGSTGVGKKVVDNAVDFKGKYFDFDNIKIEEKYNPDYIEEQFMKQTGRYFDSIEVVNIVDSEILQCFIRDNNYVDEQNVSVFFLKQTFKCRKQNVVADVTVDITKQNQEDRKKLGQIGAVASLGSGCGKFYTSHIVWCIDSINISAMENIRKGLALSDDIFVADNCGISQPMKKVVENIRSHYQCGGYFWILYNKIKVGNEIIFDGSKQIYENQVVKGCDAVKIKNGSNIIDYDMIDRQLITKCNLYMSLDKQTAGSC